MELQQIVEDTWNSSKQVTQDKPVIFNMESLSDRSFMR